jgi:two-component system cell cycle response regulator
MTGRILIVDDRVANLGVLEAKLASEYFDVSTATSGQKALDLVNQQPPDIILLDVMMPDMDGYQVCEILKKNPKTAHIPVIMVTALGELKDRIRGLQAGADEFLTKPVQDLQLLSRVRSLIRLKVLMDSLKIQRMASSGLGIPEEQLVAFPTDDQIHGVRMACLMEDDVLREKIESFLSVDKHNLSFFTSLDSFSKAVDTRKYDMALVPLIFHGEETLRLCSQIRSSPATRHLPIVMISQDLRENLLAKALDIGVNDYILEPIEANEIRLRIRTQAKRLLYQKLLRLSHEKSMDLSLTDELTKLYNRRYFNAHLDALLQMESGQRRSSCLMIIDIDHFKSINDTFGHDQGDKVLVEMARLLQMSTRDSDLVARLGGEEFVVVVDNATLGTGLRIAERLRRAVENKVFSLIQGGTMTISISIGVTVSGTDKETFTRDQMIKAADVALYQAKHAGRNRTVVGYADVAKAVAV